MKVGQFLSAQLASLLESFFLSRTPGDIIIIIIIIIMTPNVLQPLC
jgi:hypothetical protein